MDYSIDGSIPSLPIESSSMVEQLTVNQKVGGSIPLFQKMITFSILILISGILLNRHNFLVICMILELIYLLIGYLLISFNMDLLVLIIIGITGCETAIGLSILLGYYLRIH